MARSAAVADSRISVTVRAGSGTSFGVQRACVWAGLALVPLFFVGLGLIAHFIPPPAPGMTARAVARMYTEHRLRIRIGVTIAMFAAVLLAPFFAIITVQMRRVEGRHSPLSYVQMMLGACLVLVFIIPMLTWQAAAFRPERAVQVTQALNDLAWLPFVGIVSTFVLQAIVIAIVILGDRREAPIYPSWVAYLNLWAAVGVIPGAFVVFAKHGPLGWNGLLAWWLIITAFFVWMCVMAKLTLSAISRQQGEEAAAPAPDDGRPEGDRVAQLAAEVAALRAELRNREGPPPGDGIDRLASSAQRDVVARS